jgi:hypothetical protein
LVFECTDSSCGELTDSLISGLVDFDDTGSDNNIIITLPETTSETYFIAYAFAEETDTYLPHYTKIPVNGGDDQESFDATVEKGENCKSEVRSLSVTNTGKPSAPVTVDVEAAIEADTYSAFILNDEVYPYAYDQDADANTLYQDWYSSEVEVEMVITREFGVLGERTVIVETQTQTVNILAEESENVRFVYTPTFAGEYTVTVTTTVTDDQCASTIEDYANDNFIIEEAEDVEFCYTEIQDLDVHDSDGNVVLTAQTGEEYTVIFEKISNAIASDESLTALETDIDAEITNDNGDVDFSLSDTAAANADTTTYEEYSFAWTPISEGVNTIYVSGIAADCPYSTNNPEAETITVDVEGKDIEYDAIIDSCDAYPNPAFAGEEIQFDVDLASWIAALLDLFGLEDITYEWDFDDGDTSTDKEPTHSYDAAGTYDVTVTATDQYGSSDTCNVTVEVIENQAPTISCDFDGTTGIVNEEVTLEVTATDSDGTIQSYDWNFGDGNIDTTRDDETTHTYTDVDTYTVTVTATDDYGDTGSCSGVVIIETDNQDPSVTCDFDGTTGIVNEEVTLEVTATDSDGIIRT